MGTIDQRLPGPHNVATDPAYRRRGRSRACMTARLEWFARRGIAAVDLRASVEGAPLHASLGFVRLGEPSVRLLIPAR